MAFTTINKLAQELYKMEYYKALDFIKRNEKVLESVGVYFVTCRDNESILVKPYNDDYLDFGATKKVYNGDIEVLKVYNGLDFQVNYSTPIYQNGANDIYDNAPKNLIRITQNISELILDATFKYTDVVLLKEGELWPAIVFSKFDLI